MKSIVNRMALVLVIGALAAGLTWAKTTEREVTFTQAVTVNDTLIKKGTYHVSFNEETGELKIKKGKKIVATAQARLEQTEDRATLYTRSVSNEPGKPPALLSVSFKKGAEAVLINGTDTRASSSGQ